MITNPTNPTVTPTLTPTLTPMLSLWLPESVLLALPTFKIWSANRLMNNIIAK